MPVNRVCDFDPVQGCDQNSWNSVAEECENGYQYRARQTAREETLIERLVRQTLSPEGMSENGFVQQMMVPMTLATKTIKAPSKSRLGPPEQNDLSTN
jgi:hypothetical protein